MFLAIAWLVTIQVVILEDTGARIGLGRSWELTRGNRLCVLETTIVGAIITGIMLAFFLLPLFALLLRCAMNGPADVPPVFAWILAGLFWILGSVLITPLQYLAWSLVYLDLRARNDVLKINPQRDRFDPAPAAHSSMD